MQGRSGRAALPAGTAHSQEAGSPVCPGTPSAASLPHLRGPSFQPRLCLAAALQLQGLSLRNGESP